jgi:hypothetical protein
MAKLSKGEKIANAESKDGSEVQWKPLATFSVTFQSQGKGKQLEQQTIVHHQETGQTEQWSGVADQAFPKWILERLSEATGLMVASEPVLPEAVLPAEVELASTTSEAVLPAKLKLASGSFTNLKITNLEITEIRVIQSISNEVSIVANSGRPFFIEALSSQAPFSVEVAFSMVGVPASEMEQHSTPYELKVFIGNRDRAKSLELTRSGALIPGTLTYTETFSEIKLDAGIYRLEALVRVGSVFSKKFKISQIEVN